MLRCSCSRMLGSWVWKPGERQAKPTSFIFKPLLSRAVKGAEGREVKEPWAAVLEALEVRSSLCGRCRAEAGTSGGDEGSFLTTIWGAWPDRVLLTTISEPSAFSRVLWTYCLGEGLPAEEALGAAFSPTTIGSLLLEDVDEGEAVLRSFPADAARFDVAAYGLGLMSWWECDGMGGTGADATTVDMLWLRWIGHTATDLMAREQRSKSR